MNSKIIIFALLWTASQAAPIQATRNIEFTNYSSFDRVITLETPRNTHNGYFNDYNLQSIPVPKMTNNAPGKIKKTILITVSPGWDESYKLTMNYSNGRTIIKLRQKYNENSDMKISCNISSNNKLSCDKIHN